MTLGVGFLAKHVVQWSARKVGFSHATARRLGTITKWSVSLVSLDVGSLLLDGVADSALERVVGRAAHNIKPAIQMYCDEKTLASASTSMDVGSSNMKTYEEAYPLNNPFLAFDDSSNWETDQDVNAEDEAYENLRALIKAKYGIEAPAKDKADKNLKARLKAEDAIEAPAKDKADKNLKARLKAKDAIEAPAEDEAKENLNAEDAIEALEEWQPLMAMSNRAYDSVPLHILKKFMFIFLFFFFSFFFLYFL